MMPSHGHVAGSLSQPPDTRRGLSPNRARLPTQTVSRSPLRVVLDTNAVLSALGSTHAREAGRQGKRRS